MYVCIHFKNIPFITNLGNSTKRKEYFLKVKKKLKSWTLTINICLKRGGHYSRPTNSVTGCSWVCRLISGYLEFVSIITIYKNMSAEDANELLPCYQGLKSPHILL